MMSTRYVIPVGARPTDVAWPDHHDPARQTVTWVEIAVECQVDSDKGGPLIENLDSEWCVENGIDGLGICTEQSGQEAPAQKSEREAREARIAEAVKAASDSKLRQVDGAVAELEVKGLLTTAEAAAMRAAAPDDVTLVASLIDDILVSADVSVKASGAAEVRP